jgi:microcystin-dependent protein
MPFEPFIGEIYLFAGNFAPRGYALCQGQLLPIAQNTALFSILGTTYGGNGVTTFALPDLRGRAPIGVGQGPGLSTIDLGQVGGQESVTLTVNQLAPHSHPSGATNGAATSTRPSGRVDAGGGAYADTADALKQVDPPVGGGAPHGNMQPYLGLNYCIAMEGIFPSRN